jgi:crotonobetainyl-CoA:carnitine CoA-transferase CaiB-like acyl-CoA transferase
MTYLPLSGVRVLEWARDRPGPLTARKLADMGADVVKVLDVSRREIDALTAGHALTGGTRVSPVLDRNKRSIFLDFTDQSDRATLMALTESADVIVEGTRPGAFTARTGVDFHGLRRAKPSIVICSVSGFGQTGPLANLAAHGTNMDALAGVLPLEQANGHWAYSETCNLTWTIELGMLHAVGAILAALYSARATGEGAWIDLSCWDAAIEANRRSLTLALNDDPPQDTRRMGPHASVYDAKDGRPVVLSAIIRKFWDRLCEALERPDLADRWRESFSGDETLRPELQAIFATRTAAEWNDFFLEHDIAGSNTLTKDELLGHPHFEGRGMVARSASGDQRLIADAIRWMDDGSRPGYGFEPTHAPGADTEAVLTQWLGATAPGASRPGA